MGSRIRAWKRAAGFSGLAGCYFITDALQLVETDVLKGVLRALDRKAVTPCLVVIDTLARCFAGRDENSAKDVGEFIVACDVLRKSTGATVLVLHHTGKSGELERGSSALRGAADTMISCRPISGMQGFSLSCDKQKDAEPFPDITFELRNIALEQGGSSCVASPVDLLELKVSGPSKKETAALDALRSLGAASATATEWQRCAEAVGVPERTFYRIQKKLLAAGKVSREGDGKGARYRVAAQ